MGGQTSKQKRIKKGEYQYVQAKEQECQNTLNPNNDPNLETNSRHEASAVLNNIPMYRRYPIDYEAHTQRNNTVDSNVNSRINSVVENIQTAVDKIGGLTVTRNNCWELDEDEEGLSTEEPSGKPWRELKQRFDCPAKQTVQSNNISVTDDSYYGTSVTRCQYDHNALHNSDCDNDNADVEQFSGHKFNHRSSFDILDILSFPAEWSSCALDTVGFVDVTAESDEGKAVLRFFHRTSVSASFKLRITSVTRIENPFLHSLYMLKKEEMESRNGRVDELYLYHGTKSENVETICHENLNWRLYTDKHKFGRGVSFSPSAVYSSHYSDSSDEKVMFLYKVLVSNAEFGSSDMVIPSIQSGVAFDTSIKEDTSVVVKYSDNEFYPLYKITYTRHSNT